jgi:hypothetical protein
MRTAWLLGAGFSYELGMPLVWELTAEFKRWLTPDHFREIVGLWATKGDGLATTVVDAVAERLARNDEHYEQLIAWLQEESFGQPAQLRSNFDLVIHLVQGAIGQILYQRHVRNPEFHRLSLPWFKGLASAVPADQPLWVFTLNHDLHVELLATELEIPVSCGFPELCATSFGTVDGRRLSFDRLPRARLNAHDFAFATGRAINLVKLHGSLDVFAYRDALDYLRLRPDADAADGWLHALDDVETRLRGTLDGNEVRLPGEITVDDDVGVMQFLRRTLVAGGFKFDGRAQYNAPGELVEFFGRKLEDFDELVVIGYGWADRHINVPIEQWLANGVRRRLTIVNPAGLPNSAQHLAASTTVVAVTAADYLASLHGEQVPLAEERRRQFGLAIRGLPKERASEVIHEVMQEVSNERINWLARQEVSEGCDLNKLLEQANRECPLDQEQVLERIVERLRTTAR